MILQSYGTIEIGGLQYSGGMIVIDLGLQRVLWACYEYWQGEKELPTTERVICFSWVVKLHEKKFGTRFHQSKLQQLEKLGYLNRDDTARGGNRRYYTIVDPGEVDEFLKQKGMIS